MMGAAGMDATVAVPPDPADVAADDALVRAVAGGDRSAWSCSTGGTPPG